LTDTDTKVGKKTRNKKKMISRVVLFFMRLLSFHIKRYIFAVEILVEGFGLLATTEKNAKL